MHILSHYIIHSLIFFYTWLFSLENITWSPANVIQELSFHELNLEPSGSRFNS